MVNFRCKIVDEEGSTLFSTGKLITQIKGMLADFKEIAAKASAKADAKKEAERAGQKEERQERRTEQKAAKTT